MRRATVAIAVALATTASHADEQMRVFSLQASADAACPAIGSFSKRVLARTSRARLGTSGSADVAFVVSVELAAEGAAGTLEVTEGAAHSVRNVRGASCEEVVDALALIAAVTLDPNASTRPIASDVAPAPTAAASTAPTEPARAPSPIPPRAAPPNPPAESTEPGPSWRFGGGVRGLVTQGLAPDPVIALGAFLSARLPEEGSGFEPLLLAGVWLAESSEYAANARSGEELGTARFRWLAGDVVGCPLRFPESGEFEIRPCIGFEAGRLTGKGQAAKNSAEESATWLAMTGNARIGWMLFDRLELDLTVGGFVSLLRDDFFFEPAPGSSGTEGVVVHEIPPAGFRGSLGLGVVFP